MVEGGRIAPKNRAEPDFELPPPILSDPVGGPARALLHACYDALWLLAILVASPWWAYRCLTDRRFRRMASDRLGFGLPMRSGREEGRRIVIHGVSVGEVKAALPIVRELTEQYPGCRITICTTTETGVDVARQSYPELEIVRFPLDLSFVVRRFFRRLDPACVVLLELEIWPNFLRIANRAGVPVAVVNGRITDKSYARYRLFRNLLPQFRRISLLCVQDEEYARRFGELSGLSERILVTGNVKADCLRVGAPEIGEELVRLLGGGPEQPVVVAGSTHEPEERLVAEAWLAGVPRSRLVLVPRHPERVPAVKRTLAELGVFPQLLTELRAGGEPPDSSRPVIVDTIGELDLIYCLADLVFVGGSLVPHGGQNMLEPAARGRPVLHGPHVDNFAQEAALLERAGASLRLSGAHELAPTLASLLDDPERRAGMSAAGMRAVEAQQGATQWTVRALAGCLLPS